MFFHCRMLVGRGNMRLMECLHTSSQRSRIKNGSNIFSAFLTCVSKYNSMVFFTKNERLFFIERKKRNCRLDCVCRLTFYPVDGEKSTIYVYLIKRWDAPANGTCCQRVFGAHCARCSQHTKNDVMIFNWNSKPFVSLPPTNYWTSKNQHSTWSTDSLNKNSTALFFLLFLLVIDPAFFWTNEKKTYTSQ